MARSLPESTTNIMSGTVAGSVVQARVIEGGVHVHRAAPAYVTPRQLPPEPAHFTARQQETELLDSFVTEGQSCQRPNVVALTGPGGAGKTATALHWLHRNLGRFPDGQLYADLGAFGPNGPNAPSTVLSGFLRALGVPAEDVPLELAEQAALYRSMIADKAIVVFADDAESVAQVRPLLPAAPHSALVTTSRRRLGALSMDGARFVPVDALDEPAAVELIRHVIGGPKADAEAEPTRALVRLCGGLPIALRIAAARLLSRPSWSIARVVTMLADERRRLSLAVPGQASVRASLDLSYAELHPEAARLYRYLGLHPGPEFDLRAAAAVADLHAGDADDLVEELVEELVDVSLVDEVADHRFRLHDLVRLHAGQRAEQDDERGALAAAEERVIGWYLDRAVAADLVVLPHRTRVGNRYDAARHAPPEFSSPAAALGWLEAELPNLLGAQRRAADRGWWPLAWQLCEAMWGLFLYRKHFEHWIPAHELGVEAARRCADPAAHARLSVQLGFAYLNLHHHDEARGHFTDALAVSRAAADAHGEATALEHLGLAARGSGHLQAAMEHFVQAIEITERLGAHRGTALHLRRIGETLAGLGRDDEAVHYLRRAVETATGLGDRVLTARALTRLGAALVRLGHADEAHDQLAEAVRILAESGSGQYHGEALEALADLHVATGEHALAREQLGQALDLYRASGLPQAEQVRERLASLGSPRPPRPRAADSRE